jgi:hypothetical protein
VKDDKTIRVLRDERRERVEVFATLGEDERVATLAQFGECVEGNPSRALLIVGDGAEDLLDAGLESLLSDRDIPTRNACRRADSCARQAQLTRTSLKEIVKNPVHRWTPLMPGRIA